MAKNNNEHVVRQKLCFKYNSTVNTNSKNVESGFMLIQNKGITLVALMVTVIVLLMISTVGIYTSLDRFELNDYKKMKSDLELLEDKVSDYYLKYEGLPVLRTSDSNIEVFSYKEYIKGLTNANQEPATNANDNDIYYIIDLEALGNITLNYGKDFEKYKSNNVVQNVDTDIYIINEESHTIYYVKGIKMDDVIYHYIKRDEQISDDVPPTAPQIKVVSGTQNQGMFTNKVKLEIIPGKEKITEIEGTTYIVKKIENESESQLTQKTIKETQQIEITDSGKYKVSAYTKDIKGNQSKTTEYELAINIIYYRKKNGENAQGYVLNNNENTEVWDLFNNKLTVPAGFKITYDSKNVTEGTVIEDENGNQFVWIPVGTVYQNEEQTESKKIVLARYAMGNTIDKDDFYWYPKFKEDENGNKVLDKNGNKIPYGIVGQYGFNSATLTAMNVVYEYYVAGHTNTYDYDYYEDIVQRTASSNTSSNNINTKAKDIVDFTNKAIKSGGYYFGRYEAKTETKRESSKDTINTKIKVNAKDYVFNFVTQSKASELCQEMYKSTSEITYPFESDLINSYSWDTAVMFIDMFGRKSSEDRYPFMKSTGEKCHINGMNNDYAEFSTEWNNSFSTPCTIRGSSKGYVGQAGQRTTHSNNWNDVEEDVSFRPILYL